jgi:hypothetical protein
MRRRVVIPQRKRIFLGCEGESEQSYGALLSRVVEEQHKRSFLDTVLLRPGGGDPLALVQLAAGKLKQRQKKGGEYAAAYVLLDSDKTGAAPQRDQQAAALAQTSGLVLIWQEPCHEALLLRHLQNCEQLRPQTTALAISTLKQRWPNYTKGMPASKLAGTLSASELRRVRVVENALNQLLTELEFQ